MSAPHPLAPTSESWPQAALRAVWLALWVVALLILAAATAFTWSNWHRGDDLGDLGLQALFGAALIGLPIGYRRLIPRALRWPATKRAWLLALPLIVGLALGALLILASGLRGALRG